MAVPALFLRAACPALLVLAGTLCAEEPRAPAPQPPDVDLIGDRPPVRPAAPNAVVVLPDGTPAALPNAPAVPPSAAPAPAAAPASKDLLLEMPAPTPLSKKARRAYALLASTKDRAERISAGLDDGGKEVTQLEKWSNELSSDISDLADLWDNQPNYLDLCAEAKGKAVLLNDELRQVPRNWKRLRMAMNMTLRSVATLRHAARALADAEPKPQALHKDGQIVYIEPEPPPMDANQVRKDEKLREAEAARERMRRREEDNKKRAMPIDLNGVE